MLLSKLKQLRYFAEALIVKVIMNIFYFIGPKNASNSGSFLARYIGKIHQTHQLAAKNMAKAIPHLNEIQINNILDDMWDNLGRIAGEYVHIARATPADIMKLYVDLDSETRKNIEYMKNSKKGGIIFSGHIGNWEVGPKVLLNFGINVSTVYRPLNNPYVEKMISLIRGSKLIAKGVNGNRKIIEALKNGEFVIILADQKISEGQPVKFFHEDAITTTSIARIALKYDVPLIPARSIRIGHEFKFQAHFERPLDFQKSYDINKDVLDLTRLINKKLESWIVEHPAQWFWVHNRWKK